MLSLARAIREHQLSCTIRTFLLFICGSLRRQIWSSSNAYQFIPRTAFNLNEQPTPTLPTSPRGNAITIEFDLRAESTAFYIHFFKVFFSPGSTIKWNRLKTAACEYPSRIWSTLEHHHHCVASLCEQRAPDIYYSFQNKIQTMNSISR